MEEMKALQREIAELKREIAKKDKRISELEGLVKQQKHTIDIFKDRGKKNKEKAAVSEDEFILHHPTKGVVVVKKPAITRG